jgi:hypothetical protein
MSEIPLGLSLDQDSNGFTLRRKSADGTVVAIQLSGDELLGLKAQIDLWSSRLLQSLQEKSLSVRPIVVHAVRAADLAMDALQENILLALQAPTGEHMTFELPPEVAAHIATQIPDLLRQLGGSLSQH